MHTDELHFDLPPDLIAQQPAERRGASRLMVLAAGEPEPRAIGTFEYQLLRELRHDDLVVANDSRVLHARIPVRRAAGGVGELLLLEPARASGSGADELHTTSRWIALARPSRRLSEGSHLQTEAGERVLLVQRRPGGDWIVELPVAASAVGQWLHRNGQVPLPPYIEPDGQPADRYQTVYAADEGSVAAPTAGLHFDDHLWARMADHCEVTTLTLHVGAGTFQPVRGERLAEHDMHAERYVVPDATAAAVTRALAAGRRVVAVGTTTTRVLESVFGPAGKPLRGSTDLFVTPGYRFACVSALLTNFHIPRSTLLALVMAFAGVDTVRAAYERAIAERMRFYSFGDAMFVHGHEVAR